MNSITNQSSNKRTIVTNYICAVLALVLLVTQFLPFWGCYQCKTCGDGKIISINEYVWMANEHKTGLTTILQTYYIPDFTPFDVVSISLLLQMAAIATVILALSRPQKLTAVFLALIAGLICTLSYLLQPTFQMGQMWQVHLGIGIALCLCALAILAIRFAGAYAKAKADLNKEAEMAKQ